MEILIILWKPRDSFQNCDDYNFIMDSKGVV